MTNASAGNRGFWSSDIPSAEYLQTRLLYQPDTGHLVWRERDRGQFKTDRAFSTWNSRFSGKKAGYVRRKKERGGIVSSICVCIDGNKYLSHRVIYQMVFGGVHSHTVIDHINGDPTDNRLYNLRTCSHSENSRNRGVQKNNSTGFKGVYFSKSCGKYYAQISLPNRRRITSKLFQSASDAFIAQRELEILHYREFSIHNRSLSTRKDQQK